VNILILNPKIILYLHIIKKSLIFYHIHNYEI